jgi:hypothetical protein
VSGTEDSSATKVGEWGNAQQVMHKVFITKNKRGNPNVLDVKHSLTNGGKDLAISRT